MDDDRRSFSVLIRRMEIREAVIGLARHPVLVVFVVALVARVALSVTVFLVSDGVLFDDDRRYLDVALAIAGGQDLDGADFAFARQAATFLYPLAAVLWVGGKSVLAGQLLSAIAGASTAALTAWLCLRATGSSGASLVAGAIVALFPSQVFWSSLVLKDVFVWLAVVLVCVGFEASLRSGDMRVSLLGLFGLVGVGFLRAQSVIVASVALVIAGFCVRPSNLRFRFVAVGILVLLFVPWASGYGPAGSDFLGHWRDLSSVRSDMATGETALDDVSADGLVDELRRLPGAIGVFMAEPVPWEPTPSPRLEPARWESVLWYAVMFLAVVGVATEVRRRRWTILPLLFASGIIAVYALAEGNLGTAYRHRGEVVWVAAIFAGIGWHALGGRARTAQIPT